MRPSLLILIPAASMLAACAAPALPTPEPGSTPQVAMPAPAGKPTHGAETLPAAVTYGITNRVDQAVPEPDGYVLYGHLAWTDLPPYSVSAVLAGVKDANGDDVPYEYADLVTYAAQGERANYWAYKLKGVEFAVPVSLSFVVQAALDVDGGSFTFDPGPDPKLGQTWEIDQDVIVNGETVHVLSAEEAGIEEGYFRFTMQSDSSIVNAVIIDPAQPPVGGGGGGGDIPVAGQPFFAGYQYQAPLPRGPYTLTFIRVGMLVPGDWTLSWAP